MWQTIEHLLMSPNATIILVFLAFAIIIGLVLSKTGLLNIHTDTVSLGAANKEREIIRQQVEWVRLHCEGAESAMKKPEEYDSWKGKYIAEMVYDEYVEWITFNHLSTSSAYIEIKQDKIVNLVHSLTQNPAFHTKEFEDQLREDTKQSIEKLVQIRGVYK